MKGAVPMLDDDEEEEGMREVRKMLDYCRLGKYADVFASEGYDDLDYLRSLNDGSLRTLAMELGLKPGHAAKLAAMLPLYVP